MKRAVPVVLLCLFPLSALALLFYCLETYYEFVHGDQSTVVCGYAILALIGSTVVCLTSGRKNKKILAMWVVSAVILAFVLYTGSKIPFCAECDEVTAEELGFLTRWIKPYGIR